MFNDDEVLKHLESANWDDIIVRLTRFTIWRASQYKWKTGNPNQLPKGLTPNDIALNAVEKIFNGSRKWEPDRYPDLLLHLEWIVKSDISHLHESMEHRMCRKTTDSASDKIDDSAPNPSSPLSSSLITQTPEEYLLSKEQTEHEERVKQALSELVKGDEELEFLLMCFDEGIDKPESIASEMGCDVTRVYNLKRKLARKAFAIIKLMKQE